METIKVSIDINVNFSEGTQNFIKSLFASCRSTTGPVSGQDQEQENKAQGIVVSDSGSVQAQDAVAPKAKLDVKPESGIDIEAVRRAVAEKINEHRDEIKGKLTELGSPSITKLDPAKYQEMFDFVKAL